MYAESIKSDPFIRVLLAKMPAELRSTFSDTQLLGLKQALDSQTRSAHALDFRRTFGFWRWNFYFVLLFGQERRELSRRAQKIERMAILAATIVFVTVSTLFGLLFLYLVKSAMGINLFPNFSLGIWDWFKAKYL